MHDNAKRRHSFHDPFDFLAAAVMTATAAVTYR